MQQPEHQKIHAKILKFFSILGILMALVGCGGGSSGSPPTLVYTGVTTPAAIDADNAETLLTGAFEGGLVAPVFNIFAAVQADSSHSAPNHRMLALAEVFEIFLYRLDLQPQQSVHYAGAIIGDSETLQGNCGGFVHYDVELDSIFGDFSGTADFRGYCDASNPDLVLDGVADFSGDYEILSLEIDDFRFIFKDFSVASNEGSYVLNGSLDANVSATRVNIKTSSTLEDAGTGKIYWLENFAVRADYGNGFVDIALNGRYYDYDHGYVDISTDEPFRINDYEDWPAGGILAMQGAVGEQGGNTMARLVVSEEGYYEVEADTDGDGAFDDYSSGPLYWGDM